MHLSKKLKYLLKPLVLIFLASYIIAGTFIVLVDLTVYVSAIYLTNNYLIAQALSWLISCLIGVIVFRKYVYKKNFFFSFSAQLVQSIILLILVFSISMVGTFILVEIYDIGIYVSKFIIIVSTILINFVIRTTIIFK